MVRCVRDDLVMTCGAGRGFVIKIGCYEWFDFSDDNSVGDGGDVDEGGDVGDDLLWLLGVCDEIEGC